ncbi:MAG: alpha/beta fold hydrolase [Spirochaetia bacterium]|nr:alpha/beta fold hydrolase [Spirochaetia bacterium]
MKARRLGFIVALLILLFIVVSLITTKLVYDAQFPRHNRPDEAITAALRYSDIAEEHPRILVSFPSGKNNLQGYLYTVENPRALMVISHGLGGGADSYLSQIRFFIDQGLAVFAFDNTGSYDSEGKSTRGFPQSLVDLDAALSYISLQPELAKLPLLLFGHSWGGYAVANVLNYPHDIQAVISVSGPSTAMDMIIEQGQRAMGNFIYSQYPFLWLYQHLLFGKAASLDAVTAINSSGIPFLIIHGIADEMIDYEGSALIARRENITNERVRFITATTESRNGHNNLFRSDDAISYIQEVNIRYRALYDSHNQDIPYEVKKAFYNEIDRSIVHQLEPTLMVEIKQFIDKVLEF